METLITIPFVFWNKNIQEPEHKINCMKLDEDCLATGSVTGEICIWEMKNETYIPKILCSIGKVCTCIALTFVHGAIPELVGSYKLIASLHCDNKLRVWDRVDGRCTSSSSSTLLPNYRFNQLQAIQKQFLAVAGENSDIMLIDVWSMERIAYFSMTSSVVALRLVADCELWAVDLNGTLRSFYIPTMENYFFDMSCVPEINNTPSITYNIKEEVNDICISSCNQLIILKLTHGIRLYLKQWILDGKNEYAHIESYKITSVFCNENIILISSDKVFMYPVSLALERLAVVECKEKFSRSNSLSSIKVHSLDEIFKSEAFELDINCSFNTLFNNQLYGCKGRSVVEHKLSGKISRCFFFSFKPISFECFSDMCIHHLLSGDEEITCSQMYLTSEWPLYILGTSAGKIFVCPFHPSQSIQCFHYHMKPITCIFIKHDKMITTCKANLMCLWNLELAPCGLPAEEISQKDKSRRRSVQVLHYNNSTRKEIIHYKPGKVIQFYFGTISRIIRIESLRDEQQIENTNLLLGQADDYSIILICLVLGQVISFFPPISGSIKECYYKSSLDYLYVVCETDELYIFNLASNILERVITGVDLYSILRKAPRTRLITETLEEVVEDTSAKQRITLFNLRQLFPASSPTALKVAKIKIGGVDIPLLTMNIQQIVKKIKKVESPSAQLEYILSLLTCWTNGCKAHDSMCESIKEIINMNVPFIKANIGTIGVDNSMSFTLPNEENSFEVSSYITALVMSAGYSIVDALSRFITSRVNKSSRVVTAHLLSSAHHSDNFKVPFLSVLGIQSLSGITTSRYILQDNLSFLDLQSKNRMMHTLNEFITEQWSLPNSLSSNHKQRNYVGLIEALCALLLGHFAIEFKQSQKEVIPMILGSLRCMLKTDTEGYVVSAANILGKGMSYWKSELSTSDIKQIVKELLFYGCKETQLFKTVFKKALMHIAVCDFLNFIEIIAQEIENMDIDPHYPSACIQVLDLFIAKRYEQVVAYLPAVIELIVRTLNPHNPMLRKTTIEKAGHTLKTLILKLPMVAFCQVRQRLAIGTLDNLVVVYDLKTASQWKILKGHTGPVCAVQFDHTGDFLASYSSIDASLKIWKLKSGILQDLIWNSSSNALKTVQLDFLEPFKGTYQKFLDMIRLNWANDDKIFLSREDGNRYPIKYK